MLSAATAINSTLTGAPSMAADRIRSSANIPSQAVAPRVAIKAVIAPSTLAMLTVSLIVAALLALWFRSRYAGGAIGSHENATNDERVQTRVHARSDEDECPSSDELAESESEHASADEQAENPASREVVSRGNNAKRMLARKPTRLARPACTRSHQTNKYSECAAADGELTVEMDY
jgi:hypothetical protein